MVSIAIQDKKKHRSRQATASTLYEYPKRSTQGHQRDVEAVASAIHAVATLGEGLLFPVHMIAKIRTVVCLDSRKDLLRCHHQGSYGRRLQVSEVHNHCMAVLFSPVRVGSPRHTPIMGNPSFRNEPASQHRSS